LISRGGSGMNVGNFPSVFCLFPGPADLNAYPSCISGRTFCDAKALGFLETIDAPPRTEAGVLKVPCLRVPPMFLKGASCSFDL